MSVYDEIRKEYQDRGIDRADLDDDPDVEFDKWFQRAIDHSPGRWSEPNAMTLSTCDLHGMVTSRTLLLKQHNRDGFLFFTNYDSEKGQQLAVNPQGSLLFHWPYLGQQVRIFGSISRTSRAISEEYFHSRPRGAQLGAAASNQSSVLTDRDELTTKVEKLALEVGEAPVPLPENWGGYCLSPTRFEFWQGRSNRLHDRFQYRRVNGDWHVQRLSP